MKFSFAVLCRSTAFYVTMLIFAAANLWSAEILKHRHPLPAVFAGLADALEALAVLFVATVRKVQPRHVHSSHNECANGLSRRRGRTERADNLSAAAKSIGHERRKRHQRR